jgi:GDPmannose 4,6-dehydratase
LSSKTALITGITGQDGSILAQILIEKGYRVFGLRPYLPIDDTERLFSVLDAVTLLHADMSDMASLVRIITQTRPDEIYNLAALTHVGTSFVMPEATANVNALGVVRLMEAMRATGIEKSARLYQASSSEMFGNAPAPQTDSTPFQPCSPYGCAKLYAHGMVQTYRAAYGMHASCGILFNHESPVRGEDFVTRKITRAIGDFLNARKDPLRLGNLDARRDWGHARDYMEGAWRMLQQPAPDDYILATGETHSVRDFATAAFACAGYDIAWSGTGESETGRDKHTGRVMVEIDATLFRPVEINTLCGDATKARHVLGWSPQISFESLVQEMVAADAPNAMPKRLYA